MGISKNAWTPYRSIFDPEKKKQRLAELDKVMAKERDSGTTRMRPRR